MLSGSFWLIAAIDGITGLLAAFYAIAPLDAPPVVRLGILFLPFLACAAWVERDARHHRVTLPTDWGFFGLLGWPVLIPWYAWHTRSRARWRLIVGLYSAMLAPYFVALWAMAFYAALSQ